MNRQQLLAEFLDRERNNLLCYSKSLLMDKPKSGYEKEWQTSLEKINLIEQMEKEHQSIIPQEHESVPGNTPTERIASLLDRIGLYSDPEKYKYDFDKVEHLLQEAAQVVEDTARGIRPKNLPKEIPFSDALNEEDRSTPYSYAGDMSPEEYDKMMENYELDLHSVIVYQSPDGKHCAMQRQDNFGIPDETTGVVGKRYVLPEGISVPEDCNRYHQLQNDDDPDQEIFIDNDINGVPAVHMVYKDAGGSYQDIIPMKEYEAEIQIEVQEKERRTEPGEVPEFGQEMSL